MNSEALTDLVVDALDDVKARDIVRLDVRDVTTVTDFMVVASGTSNRHVKALVDNVAEKAKAAGVDTVAFDRAGFRYHGRVKALADAAREAGLKF